MSSELRTRVEKTFEKHFSGNPSHLFRAPGRVNIIGEHTDYNDGFVLPCAITFETIIACRINNDHCFRVVAADYDDQFDEFKIQTQIPPSEKHWSNYLRGVVSEFIKRGVTFSGLDLVIAGNVPQGAGLSSSASLEVCFSYALNAIFHGGYTKKELALISQNAENNFVGCNCGIMDQLISACGEVDSALLIDCRDLTTSAIEIPSSLVLLIVNPNVERKLVGSEYNLRRESCELAAQIMNIGSLREADLEGLELHKPVMSEEVFRRARHVVSENLRVHSLVEAFKNNHIQVIKGILAASHASMRNDFEITTPQLDFVADTINQMVTCGGARMTGGGFGGCAVALIPKTEVDDVCKTLREEYLKHFNKEIFIYLPQISEGVSALS